MCDLPWIIIQVFSVYLPFECVHLEAEADTRDFSRLIKKILAAALRDTRGRVRSRACTARLWCLSTLDSAGRRTRTSASGWTSTERCVSEKNIKARCFPPLLFNAFISFLKPFYFARTYLFGHFFSSQHEAVADSRLAVCLLLLELERCPGQDVLQPQDPVEPAPAVFGGGGPGCGEYRPGSRGH